MAKTKLTPKEIIKKGGQLCTVGSRSRRSELESIAFNFLVILSRTTNDFRPVTKEEYLEHRKRDNKGKDIPSSEEFWLSTFISSSYYPLKRDFCSDWE